MSTSAAALAPRWRQSEPRLPTSADPSASATPPCQPIPLALPGGVRPKRLPRWPRRPALEADLPVGARELLGPLGLLQATPREAEQLTDHAEPSRLGALLQERLLGLRRKLDRRRHPVGVQARELLLRRALVRHMLDELGVALAGGLDEIRVRLLGLVVEELDVAGRVLHVLDPSLEPERSRPLDEDVHPPVP